MHSDPINSVSIEQTFFYKTIQNHTVMYQEDTTVHSVCSLSDEPEGQINIDYKIEILHVHVLVTKISNSASSLFHSWNPDF